MPFLELNGGPIHYDSVGQGPTLFLIADDLRHMEIAANIDAVATSTTSTTRAMSDAQAAIDEVARMATSLHSAVGRFRY